MEERCVICGRGIPEGRQVCPICEAGGVPRKKNRNHSEKKVKGGLIAMGLILGILAIGVGVIGVKYSVAAIVAGIGALCAFFSSKKG